MTRIKVSVRIDPQSLETAKEQAMNMVAHRVVRGFDQRVGPHLLEVTKARAPVGKRETKNPQRSSFQKLRLSERDEGRFSTEEVSRLRDLRNMTARERAEAVTSKDIKFFRGTGANEGRTPDRVDVIRGSIRGAFIHAPGTLRDSHIYVPARRRGNKVIAEVRATAEYAAAQHEGFKHHSHGEATGLQVKGRPWMKQSLGNVKGDMTSPGTYEG